MKMKILVNSLEENMENALQEIENMFINNEASRHIIMHHLNSFLDNNLEDLLSDYTDGSILVTREITYNGLNEIRDFFVTLMTHFPKKEAAFELDKLVVQDNLAFIVWHAKTPTVDVLLGTDTFLIKDNKIHRQTFAGQMSFTS